MSDIFMVIPAPPAGLPPGSAIPVPLAADPVQDSYFSQTYASKGAAVVEIRGFSLSAENATTIGSGATGAGAGKVKFNPLQVQRSVDRLSPTLFAISSSGAHFPTVQIFVRKPGGTPPGRPYLAYEFSMVFVSGIQWSADAGEEAPVEQVDFAYGSLAVGYYPQQPDGSFGRPTKLGWSQITNTATGPDALSTF